MDSSLDTTAIDQLEARMRECTDCRLCNERTNIVFDKGQRHKPRIMMIGEAPGHDEDLAGKPFIGMAGRKLEKIMSYVGLSEDDTYITNSVLCQTPNDRNPNEDELEACRWRLHLQIKLAEPELLILLGRVAVVQTWGNQFKGALKQFFSSQVDEHWTTIEDLRVPTVVTYHPSYLLRSGRKGYRQVLPHWTMVKEWLETCK
jgi:DNA polymerase